MTCLALQVGGVAIGVAHSSGIHPHTCRIAEHVAKGPGACSVWQDTPAGGGID